MLKNLSIAMKLLLMVVVPLVGMIFFAADVVYKATGARTEMEHVHQLGHVGTAVSALVHELQKERGMSVAFAETRGAKFAAELPSQRSKADTKAVALKEALAEISGHGDEFKELDNSINNTLATIQPLRESISSFAIKATDVIERYSHLNETLLRSLELVASLTTEASIVNQFFTFANFQHFKENTGVERAVLNAAFEENAFPPGMLEVLIGSIAKQHVFEDVALSVATPAEREFYRSKVTGTPVEEVARMERLALDRAGGKLNVDPAHWFKMITAKIDQLKEVEDFMAVNIHDGSERLQTKAALSFWMSLLLGLAVVGASLLLTWLVGRSISRPLGAAGMTAQQIATQVVAAVQQQSATTNQTATSVSETTTTIEEIRQTSQMTTQKAQAVLEIAEKSAAASAGAVHSVEQGLEAMHRIRSEVEGIARNILELSEKNIQIGEIVQSVNGIAEQSNLLAVNASIEAAKAGEQGKGFAVVASEVKALASQSKEATDQIRSILGDIQKSSNAAVMVTEQGAKRVEEGTRLIDELGRSIKELLKVIERSGDAANQISVAANQQLAGIDQITGAMRSIEQAARDNANGARDLEKVAEQIRSVVGELNQVTTGRRAA